VPNQLLTNPPKNQMNSQPNTVVSSIPLPLAELIGDYLKKERISQPNNQLTNQLISQLTN
jgi:hypothetical protein